MSEIPKISGAKLYLDAQRLQSVVPAPNATMTAQQTVPVEGDLPFAERRKTPDRRKGKHGRERTPFDTRQKGERRRSRTLDYEA